VLLVHDSTTFSFGGESEREGLGRVNDGGQGMLGHFCLAVSPERVPLGVLGLKTWVRRGATKDRRHKNKKPPTRESIRWGELALGVAEELGDSCNAIHVMDSEADSYELFAQMDRAGQTFVIRAAQNRAVVGEEGPRLSDALAAAVHRFDREVPLAPRKAKEAASRSKRNLPRKARLAKLEVRTKRIELRRPPNAPARTGPATLALNFVHVVEVAPPAGQKPVDWLLITNARINTKAAVAAVIDAYRARWVIEDFFKALKTGCAFEKAQLESRDALERYLAMLLPVAWQLLLLRSIATDAPDDPATNVLTAAQLTALRVLSDKKLPKRLTVSDAQLAIAALGGHIRHNGRPGWQVLGRGMRRLVDGAEIVIRLQSAGKLDQ